MAAAALRLAVLAVAIGALVASSSAAVCPHANHTAPFAADFTMLQHQLRGTAAATIGRRFTIHHGYAVVINKFVVAGDDFTIRHAVTIGNRGPDSLACPVIGNNVELGANVVIIGDITIGNNVTIGAGSVVLDSIPDNALVVGEKARVKVIK
ncbi:hypothetical protein OsI_32360 [Oryza sativa Indica Group]|uniref:Uncharacterized protein n=1 Tax=Oryza sativa subsp. indica TaxID=39946 RepID=B8BED9_ORYSI|nr:hypothetical protein OsI_32360 [Oryza sativa Indica Group]